MKSINNLVRIVYISRAVELFANEDLEALLASARAANQSRGVTGLLLYKDLSFLQVLEGDKKPVEEIFAKIRVDQRHFRIKALVEAEPIPERSFPDWSMGFQRPDEQNDSQTVGFSDFLETQWQLQDNGEDHSVERLNTLLNYFRRNS